MKMSSFKKSDTRLFVSPKEKVPGSSYWKKFELPVLIKEYGAVDYVHFMPKEPHYFAVTSSVRVHVYDPITKHAYRSFSKFKEAAYGGSLRNDGKLLCAGGEEGIIKVFDLSSKSLLRSLRGHTGAVHRCYFSPDNTSIVSFSDDKSVILWDHITEQQVLRFQDHTDYVRAGCISPATSSIILSGSYDGTLKMYDTRSGSVAVTLDHEAPVEGVIFLPSGGVFISAGGKEVKVWDAFQRNLLTKFGQYHKTVTSICCSSRGQRVITGSLDKKIRIIDTKTYKVVHTASYTSPVLSVGVNEEETVLVVGMVNGLLSVQNRTSLKPITEESKTARKHVADKLVYDEVFKPLEKTNMTKFEFALRKFQYAKALDVVMKPSVAFKRPDMVVAVFDELIRRKGLVTAVSGRNSRQLSMILKFIIRYISTECFTRILVEVADCVIDAYYDVIDRYSGEVKKLFRTLRDVVKKAQLTTEELLKLQGALEMLFSAANANAIQNDVEILCH